LIREWPAASQQIPTDLSFNLAHERSVRLETEVVVGQIVCEEFAILEYGVDPLPEKPCIRTDAADRQAICFPVRSNDNASCVLAGRIGHT